MEIENLTFKTEKEYKEFLDYLFSIRDIEYRDFNTKIIIPKSKVFSTHLYISFLTLKFYHTLEAWLVNPEDVEKYLASIGIPS